VGSRTFEDSDPPVRAVVLSGGGARGAYEAGVLRYILEELPDDLGHPPRFDVICGTSVGAINATWLAATLDEPSYCFQRLWYLWRTLTFDRVVAPSLGNIFTLVQSLFGMQSLDEHLRLLPKGKRGGGILETTFFDRLIRKELPLDNIARNLERGLLDALTVSATNIATGQTTVFVQTAEGRNLPPWTRDPRRVALGGPVSAEKVLASAAIPLMFPPVKIGHHWFCDGGLRQNTPLSPALRLDANRVLVISLRSRGDWPKPGPFDAPEDAPDAKFPDVGMLIGKLLDALLLDPLDYDLSVLERINGILRHGEELFGDDSFTEALNDIVEVYRGQDYHIVEPLLLSPSQDLGRLASKFASAQPDSFWGSRMVASMGRAAAERDYKESDLLSYVLFDGGYTGQLLDMGYADAREIHDDLVAFFRD
jgi:NTE family protein